MLFAERCTPVVATPTGKSLHSTPLAHQFSLLPSPSLCATGSSAQEKAMGVVDTKKEATFRVASWWWALRDSNPRPSACKADALNQLS